MVSEIYKDDDGLVLRGYDLITYFDGKPQKGSKEFLVIRGDAQYYFLNKKNKELFKKNPKKYLPAYGGYCATAMSEGKYVPVYPKHYKITDGVLYLFYKGVGSDPKPNGTRMKRKKRNLPMLIGKQKMQLKRRFLELFECWIRFFIPRDGIEYQSL